MNNASWKIEEKDHLLYRISSPQDPFQMNWIEGRIPWGTVSLPEGLVYQVSRRFTDRDTLEEVYTFENITDFDVFVPEGSISIATPFNDSYHQAGICMTQRCHTHLWCGGHQSWILALRMGGAAKHLGLILTEGALQSYSVERNLVESCVSNDRGDFLLHPEVLHLCPNEKYVLRWELFWHDGKDDFLRRLKEDFGQIRIDAEQYVLFKGEAAQVKTSCPPYQVRVPTDETGEKHLQWVLDGDRNVQANFNVLPKPEELLRRRVHFIVNHQQYHQDGSHLDGAYLIYDNETRKMYYSHTWHDHNGGRERLGMGALCALYLQHTQDVAVTQSVETYARYVLRELFGADHGTVYNDVQQSLEIHRLYNYPWVCCFFMEMYKWNRDLVWLNRAADVMRAYYRAGGEKFYAIGIPMTELCTLLKAANQTETESELRSLFVAHAKRIAGIGLNYPPHEVAYEQSIVAPGVDYLLMGCELCGDEALLTAAREQIAVLELFDGIQPDYHLNTVAIRHWDGYWFGKRRLLGDTFPHYWSSLSGLVYARYANITGNERYAKMAERSLRAPLSLFFDDGSASCAMVYPRNINKMPAHDYDPWANDQDWGLYYYIKHNFHM